MKDSTDHKDKIVEVSNSWIEEKAEEIREEFYFADMTVEEKFYISIRLLEKISNELKLGAQGTRALIDHALGMSKPKPQEEKSNEKAGICSKEG